MSRPAYITVIGASAGGLKALTELVSHFRNEMDTAVFIVMHLSASSVSEFLLVKLRRHTSFKISLASDGMPIEQGYIYIAPANSHLLVNKDEMRAGKGPPESRWRPSIDVMFRSAAASWSNNCIGIVLTGLLDDGVVGIQAIRKSKGICIVQDPNEAEFPDMPVAVLNHLEPDYCLPLAGIGETLFNLTTVAPAPNMPAPPEVLQEASIAANVALDFKVVEEIGQKSQYACPDCGGGLYTIKEENGNGERYRCHIGHAYTEKDLVLRQNETLESTLWIALRIMEERRVLLKKLEYTNAGKGFKHVAGTYHQKALELEMHIQKLKDIVFALQESKEVEK